MTLKELVKKHLSHLGVPTGTDDVCPICKDRCPPNTGLVTISHGERDVFVGCYICLDNELRDNPIGLALLETVLATSENVVLLQKWVGWLREAHLAAGCLLEKGYSSATCGHCSCSVCSLAKGDEAFAHWAAAKQHESSYNH